MSTYLYLRCTEHDPPIDAEDESGQHLTDLPRIREEVAGRRSLIAAWAEWLDSPQRPGSLFAGDENYFTRNTARFLRWHPTCALELWDEYGKRWSLISPETHPIDDGGDE